LVVGLACPPAGWAQAARKKKAAAEMPVEVQEVTVTAQRREESLQETPISVTAISTESLQNKQVRDVVDIGETVPALRIVSATNSTSSTTVTMRGLAQGNPDPSYSPKVGLYVDGVYLTKIVGSNLDLEDLERVEVLRGPQGTLYGRNTIGGAVNFITKKPDENRSITLKADVGNFETFNGRMTVNVPLIGKNGFYQSDAIGMLSLRETAGYKTHDGYWRNAIPNGAPSTPKPGGSGDYSNLNRVYNWTALRWQPRKNITVDYEFEYHRYRDNSIAFPLTYVYPGSIMDKTYNYHVPGTPIVIPIPNPVFPGGLNGYVAHNRPDAVANNAILMHDGQLHKARDDGYQRLHILTGTWDIGDVGPFGDVQLKSISSYRSFFFQSDDDLDGTPQHITDFSQVIDVQNWSQELQWLGTAPRLHYVVGAYYSGEYDMINQQQSFINNASNLPYRNFNKIKSYAGYGQASYTPPILSDKLTLTAGLRFTQEQVHLDHLTGKLVYPSATEPGFKGSGGKAFGGLHGTGTPGVSPMGDISFQWTDDLMTYARASRGYTSGGFNPTGSSPEFFLPFRPETLWAFEAGIKSQWFDNRLRLNADGYFSYYKDLQVSIFHSSPAGGVLSIPSNAERAEIWGAEFEGTAIPFRGMEATAGYSFISPKYTKWTDLIVDPVTGKILGSESVADKRSFPYTPHHQINAGLTYTAPPTTTGTFVAHLDFYWQDLVTFIPNNLTPGAQADEGWAYALVNGRLAYNGIPLQKGTMDIAVYGRNLFDRKYRTYGIDFGEGLGFAGNSYGDPRTFGLSLAYHFTAGQEAPPPPPPPVAQAPPPPPPPAKKKIVLRSVHFDFDKATLKPAAKPILDEAVQVLRHEGSVDIIVEGHTDSIGTEEYNLALSRRRADTVRTYLVNHGIARSRITAEGMGESKPVASNDTADGRAQNRRVELHVK